MPVTASAWAANGPAQKDGSQWYAERHTAGAKVIDLLYLAAPGADPQAIMAARVPGLNDQLAADEAAADFDADAAPSQNEMAPAQFAAALRQRYRASDKADTCKLAWWLMRRISAGDLTDTQCRNAFGVTAAQWTNFKTNTLTPQSNAWAAVLAATGS